MKILMLVASLCCTLSVWGQTTFPASVRIEFEKTVYVRQLIKATEPEWYEEIKDRLPETFLSYFQFTGDTGRSLYRHDRDADNERRFYSPDNNKNIVYNNYRLGTTISQKPVYDEVFLVQDSLLPIRWKLTADTRVIAGYECRKAIGFIADTLAVFAFYTDEILVTGGPESVQGLPGMILGLGFPRLHTTWFATKVQTSGVDMTKVKPETKGKKVTRQAMIEQIEKVVRQWGKYGRGELMQFVI